MKIVRPGFDAALLADLEIGTRMRNIRLVGPAVANQLKVWCPMCWEWHWHGMPEGNRASHCSTYASPYSGYDIVEGAPPDLPKIRRPTMVCAECHEPYNKLLYPVGCPCCHHVPNSARRVAATLGMTESWWREGLTADGAETQRCWAILCALQPLLMLYLHECRQVRDTGGSAFCAHDHWCGYQENPLPAWCPQDAGWGWGLRGIVSRLVGWFVKDDPILGTGRAYDIAYSIGYEWLPPCRKCSCL